MAPGKQHEGTVYQFAHAAFADVSVLEGYSLAPNELESRRQRFPQNPSPSLEQNARHNPPRKWKS
jgi:hypothetical protein